MQDLLFVRGVDGVPWVEQLAPSSARGLDRLPRLVRLGDPADELILYENGRRSLTGGAFFQFTYDMAHLAITATHVTMTRPGAPAVTYDFDTFLPQVTDSENEAALYFPPPTTEGSPSGTGYIIRTDGSFRRSLTVDGTSTSFFDLDGELLFTFDHDGVIRAHSAREVRDATIGAWSTAGPSPLGATAPPVTPQVTLWPGMPQLTVCDALGLRTLEFTPAPPLVLDGDPCLPHSVTIRRDHLVYYVTKGQEAVLRSVPLDGSAPPVALAHAEVALAIDAERVAWTTRTPTASGTKGPYLPDDVGDGWVDDKQFMERGHFATFSADGRHLYFLEHAATGDGVGELRSYEIATGTTHLLALNTRSFAELPDGRLLAVTNSSAKNVWNRVVVIDEARRTIDWVADGADELTLIPGLTDVLVGLVTNSDETTLVRMPIPQTGR
jgi:hypothetical protein